MKKRIAYVAGLAGAAALLGMALQAPVSAAEIKLKLGTVSNDKTRNTPRAAWRSIRIGWARSAASRFAASRPSRA
jgi:hypothetical protein